MKKEKAIVSKIEVLEKELDAIMQELALAYEELACVYDVSSSMGTILTSDKLHIEILSKAMSILETRCGYLMLFDEEDFKLKIRAAVGFVPEKLHKFESEFKAEESISAQAVREGKFIILSNIQSSKQIHEHILGINNILCVPMKHRDEPIGVITLGDKLSGEPFYTPDVKLLLSLATLVAGMICSKRQLIHSQRLSLIGELSASIAHEVKNPLVVISMNAKGLIEEFSKDASAIERLNRIERQAIKAMRIIEGLLTFARRSQSEIKSVNVNSIIEDSLILVESEMVSSNITLNKKLNPSLPDIQADSKQIEQVCLNIVLNAIDAMPDGGKLTISTSKNKKDVKIVFVDTGCGIPEENHNKIFEPFFTTKGERSTGLGLPISYGIIKNHGGDIEFNSKVGEGTTFTIKLPIEEVKK